MSQDRELQVAIVDDRYPQHPRWTAGERLHDLFAELVARHPYSIAMDTGDAAHTFADIDQHARSLATALHERTIGHGDRVALVLDSPYDAYAAMLAVSRVGATFVPLDIAFPADRIGYICQDADVRAIVTSTRLHDCLPDDSELLLIDVEDLEPAQRCEQPPTADLREDDALAYVIYTSGTTGRPKGVAIAHSSICNFIRVAGEVYGFTADDRVYQGMTIAFDFSVEESWVPWMAGATLVPRPSGGALVGADLQAFVIDHGITALCCVPTLLSTLDADALPGVRFVLVSGEACPPELVTRWHRADRRMLNVYGPTEATVTATWAPLHPEQPVTLGRPLPTYSAVILDPDEALTVAPGEVGEIGLAGIGLALGYLGRDDLTAAAFVDDFEALPNNPSGRIYRTGDLGRLTPDGEIVYLGRIDTQVKIRGYRIELTEIESVLLAVPGVGQAVVATWEPVAGMTELVAYYTLRDDSLDEDALHAALVDQLPPYMVPAYFHRLNSIPFTTSDKVDRRALPAPSSGRRTATKGEQVAPATESETLLAGLVEQVLDIRDVSVTADLFTDLGGNSLLMAQLCAFATSAGRPLSIRDCYRLRTVRALAAGSDAAPAPEPAIATATPATRVDPRGPRRRSLAYGVTGVVQVALVFAYLWGLTVLGQVAYDSAVGVWSAILVALSALGALCVFPIATKWVLVGRWRVEQFPLWGPRYLRFWIVKTVVRANPLVLFAGTPLYSCYLRALGAKIGPRAVIQTRHVPVCTDLLQVGADAVIRLDAFMQCYRAVDGMLVTGPVEIGARAFVGESSVLDIGSSIGTDGQLAHASGLQRGQHVPADQRWYGSPAEPAPSGSDFQRMTARPSGGRRATAMRTTRQIAGIVAVLAVVMIVLVGEVALLSPGYDDGDTLLIWAAIATTVTLVGGLLLEAAAAVAAARWLAPRLRPGVEYPTHGTHHTILRAVEKLSNRPMLISLLGDSALITSWMTMLGWNLGEVEQTGSNFGTMHRHQVPVLATVGRGTMISDGLSMANVDLSSTHFRVRETALGERTFVGNRVIVPADARIGDNVLLATKVLVPIDGPVRHDVGLLGSPPFEIPRSVDRDTITVADEDKPRLLAAKRRHNLTTMGIVLAGRWGQLFLVLALDLLAADGYARFGAAGIAFMVTASILLSAVWFVATECMVTRRNLTPRQCSIYDPYFWFHERGWKLLTPFLAILDGTPLKSVVLRMLGTKVGARLFDDGSAMPEHSLVSIGSDCTFNAGTIVQPHSLEDGMFKSGRVVIGNHVTLGVGSFVHYGTRLEDGCELAADAFLMKGSVMGTDAHWTGNPAVVNPAAVSPPTAT